MTTAHAPASPDPAAATSPAEDARRFQANLELLAEMSRDLAASRDVKAALLKAIDHITCSVEAEGGALFLLDEPHENLRCVACVGATEITGLVIAADTGIVGRCVQNDAGEIVRDVSQDPSFFGGVDEKTGYTTKSILCAPVTVKDERIGAIELINKRGDDGLFSPDDLTFLEALAASAALAIHNARQADALLEQERIKRELELAREIQRSLLPEAEEGGAVRGVNRPAREVSGDFYDFFRLADGRICFNLGDVSGKGMNAALLMAKTASLYRCLGKSVLSPGRLLALINREICETATRGMFVTMVGGVFDPRTGVVRLANAGHEPPLLLTRDGGFEAFEADGPPLGILPDPPTKEGYPEREIHLDGGSLWVFTDGVTEGYTADGGELGGEGVRRILLENREKSLEDQLGAVVAQVQLGDKGLRDDLTILGLRDDGACIAADAETPAAGADDMPGETILDLRVPARADRLKLIRQAVGAAARYMNADHDTVEHIILAVDEACQNVVRHAYGGRDDGEISLKLARDGDDLVVQVVDYAAPANPDLIKPRDLDDIRPGGLGTHLIREIMDDVRFVAPPAGVGNLLQLRKRIAGPTGGS